MKSYVPTERRFALAENKELRDPDYLSYFGSEPDGVYKWPDLFEMTPLIILGEERSGKTREFEEQIELLHKSGSYAFFLPLERLHDENLESAFSTKDLEAFKAWTESPTAVAYFFLDALDELKLREGSLRAAVKKLQLAYEPHFSRMKLVVSCRPADWQSQIGSQHLEPFCVVQKSTKFSLDAVEVSEEEQQSSSLITPIRDVSKNILIRTLKGVMRFFSSSASDRVFQDGHGSEAFFPEVISKSETVQGQSTVQASPEETTTKNSPTIVTLLPLSQNEIRAFARSYSRDNADSFCAHLETHDFWHLYRLCCTNRGLSKIMRY